MADNPLTQGVPANVLAAADQEFAEYRGFVDDLVAAHRHDLTVMASHGMHDQMSTSGILTVEILTSGKSQIDVVLLAAIAIDDLARRRAKDEEEV